MTLMHFWSGAPDGDSAQDQLFAAGLTDGLPVVPPTRERVARMLGDLPPYAVIAEAPLLFNPVTWQDAAINAVLAGCAPGVLPLIGAAVDALTAPEFNLLGIGTTTGSAAPAFIVNGPIVQRLGLHGGANALGPGNRANATIGRALAFILRNVGGATPGEVDMATLGQPAKYTCCFAENEAESPWAPLHVERGFAAGDSVVTVCGVSGTIEMVDTVNHDLAGLTQTYAQSMLIAGHCGSSDTIGGGEPLLLIPPEIATVLHSAGASKAAVREALFERALLPLERLAPAIAARIRRGRTDRGLDPDAPLRIARRPEDLLLVVAGGVGVKTCYLPAWSATQAVSRLIPAI